MTLCIIKEKGFNVVDMKPNDDYDGYYLLQLSKPYLFSWDEIPGNDNGRLIEFLIQNFGIDWVKTATIEKIDDGKTIKVSIEDKYILIKLNTEKTEVNLKIDDGRTDEFITKKENGKLNIYSKSIGKEINRYAIGFLIKNKIEKEDIEFLEKNISRKQDGNEVKYNIVITGEGCKYIYDPWNGRPINIIKHLENAKKVKTPKKAKRPGLQENIIGISKYHLGNYTFTIPLDGEKKQWIVATYNKRYLFNWDKIPGSDSGRLTDFLRQNFGVGWVKTAKTEKIDDDKTILVSFEKNSLSMSLNDEKTKVNLKIDDVRVDELIARRENGNLNIYTKRKGKCYEALLEQADKKCGINTEIKLSDILESICNAALY